MAYTIRKATREDVPEIMRLVQELADYEKMSEGPQLTEQDFIRDGGFDGSHPFYHVHVADIAPRKLAGFVLYFWTYSTWEGKAVYMEDLYVSPDWRGKGAGKALWRACVQAAIDQGCSRCNWSCLVSAKRNTSSASLMHENGISLCLICAGLEQALNRILQTNGGHRFD